MKQIPINYYPIIRSGCTIEKSRWIDGKILYGPVDSYGIEDITLLCDFEGMKERSVQFQLFTVDSEFDYNSFYSLN